MARYQNIADDKLNDWRLGEAGGLCCVVVKYRESFKSFGNDDPTISKKKIRKIIQSKTLHCTI